MTTPSRTPTRRLLAILAGSLALLPACSGEGPQPEPASVEDAPAPAPTAGVHVLGEIVAIIRPSLGTVTFVRRDHGERGPAGPGLDPQELTDLPVTQDGTPGSGPANSVEMVNNSLGYNGACPAGYQSNSFCANVTLRHFYDLSLSNVFVQVTAIKDMANAPLAGHAALNSDAASLGLDSSLGLWTFTSSGAANAGILGKSPSNFGSRDWVFANPDGVDFQVTLRVVASLYPTLWFNANFSRSQSAPLISGQPAILHFDYARLGNCRGANWRETGFFSGPYTHDHRLNVAGAAGATAFDVAFTAPFGNDAWLWFNNSDDSGCSAWDSSFGSNYHVTPQSGKPVIHLLPSFTSSVEGTLKAGSPITIDYDLNRLPSCGTVDELDRLPSSTTATMFYRFNGGAVSQVSLVGLPYGVPGTSNGQASQLQVAPAITPPAGATNVELWFQSAKASTSCINWDSNFGSNYNFGVTP
jgi:hypothetical protein